MTTLKKKTHLKKTEQGMSLVEVLIVLALVGSLYFMVKPDLRTLKSKTKSVLNQLKSDIKASANIAILSGKTHRIVFDLKTNDYWLEVTDFKSFHLDQFKEKVEYKKLTTKERKENLKEELKKYEDLAGEEVSNDKGKKLPLPSVVVSQMKKREVIQWRKTDDWSKRSLDHLALVDIKTERLAEPVETKQIKEGGPSQVTLLLLPSGFIEQALIHMKQIKDQKDLSFSIDSQSKISFESGYLTFNTKGQLN